MDTRPNAKRINMNSNRTKEPQYQSLLDLKSNKGVNQLGLMMNEVWNRDPRRLAFVLSRYKFIAKMLEGYENVLEVGCGDAWPTRIVKQTVINLTVSDFDPVFIEDAKRRDDPEWPISYLLHDMVQKPVENKYDAIYSVDVLEHITSEDEDSFITNICNSLNQNGVAIIGSPSLESQAFASPASKEGHVNCKTGKDFRETMERYFEHVFLFSMNDEVVHTGLDKMANYLFTLCCGVK
jgi:2-polyprenyl-3-methyl-5-hydroxy-6-metoxy-1,4-benzoquinol methylase